MKNGYPLTAEQYKLALQLEGVFMPQARRQRLKAGFGEEVQVPMRYVQCTSAEAALSIIKNKRLWMRNAVCMSDYREVQHGLDILRAFFSDVGRRDRFLNAIEKCHAGIGQEAIKMFDERLHDIQLETYISSISEHDDAEDGHGRLSMWRAFGSSPARVALAFRIPKMSGGSLALNLLFSPVTYLTEDEARDVFDEVSASVEKSTDFLRSVNREIVLGTIFIMLMAATVCLKHEGFKEEREWRAIYFPTVRPSPLMESSTEVVGGVPQPIYKIPLDRSVDAVLGDLDFVGMFDRLIIGPSPYPWAMYKAFTAALSEAGCSNASELVFASRIP